MAIDVYLKLDDIGLFKTRGKHEPLSQLERACQVRDQFAECMQNALRHHYCVMPELCAQGHELLSCGHLLVDYANFSGNGIPLTGRSRKVIDARLRAIGTLVFRQQTGFTGPLPGDIHVPALKRIASFTGTRKAPTTRKPAPRKASRAKGGGLLAALFGR